MWTHVGTTGSTAACYATYGEATQVCAFKKNENEGKGLEYMAAF